MMSSRNCNNKRKPDEDQLESHHHQSVKQENDGDESLPLIYYSSDGQPHLVNSSGDGDMIARGDRLSHRKCDVKEEEDGDNSDMEDIILAAEQEYERLTRIAEQNRIFLEMETRVQNGEIEEQEEEEEHSSKEEENANPSTANDDGEMMTIAGEEEEIEEMVEVASLAVDNRPKKRARIDPSSSETTKESEKQRGGRIVHDEPSFGELMMGKLREYKKHHCTTDVRYTYSSLFDWVCSLKEKVEKGTLPQHHESQLKDLGFFTSAQSSVLPSTPSRHTSFEVWMNRLTEYKKNHDTPSCYKRTFEKQVEKIREYKKQHGTVNVSHTIDKQLYHWLHRTKVKHREGNLLKKYELMLKDEGVDLKIKSREKRFHERINQLREYKRLHGTANVSNIIDKDLYSYINHQMIKYRNGKLSEKYASVLEDEGVDLKCKPKPKHTFDEWINLIREYRKLHGTVDVYKRIDKPLYRWINRQKVKLKEGTLPKECVSRLKDEGIDLKCKPKHKHTFDDWINRIREYKKLHGTVNVDKKTAMPLYRWINRQKGKLEEGTLPKECVSMLEDEGVDLKW